MPRTVGSGRKPVNRYASSSRRGFRIRASCQIFRLEVKEKTLENKGFRSLQTRFLPTRLGEEPIQDQFYAHLQSVWRQWKARGVDPAKLFNAALNDPKAFQELLKQTGFDRNAQLLRDVAAGPQDARYPACSERAFYGCSGDEAGQDIAAAALTCAHASSDAAVVAVVEADAAPPCAAGTTGLYTVRTILNAAAELESHGGPGNNTLAEAQDLDPSFLDLLKGATRGAVLGRADAAGDLYSVTLGAGQSVSAVATGASFTEATCTVTTALDDPPCPSSIV